MENIVQSVNDNERSEYVCFRKVNNVQKVSDSERSEYASFAQGESIHFNKRWDTYTNQ